MPPFCHASSSGTLRLPTDPRPGATSFHHFRSTSNHTRPTEAVWTAVPVRQLSSYHFQTRRLFVRNDFTATFLLYRSGGCMIAIACNKRVLFYKRDHFTRQWAHINSLVNNVMHLGRKGNPGSPLITPARWLTTTEVVVRAEQRRLLHLQT